MCRREEVKGRGMCRERVHRGAVLSGPSDPLRLQPLCFLSSQPEAMVFSYPALPIYDETDAIFNEMLEMFREVDIDESGTISLDEFSLVSVGKEGMMVMEVRERRG